MSSKSGIRKADRLLGATTQPWNASCRQLSRQSLYECFRSRSDSRSGYRVTAAAKWTSSTREIVETSRAAWACRSASERRRTHGSSGLPGSYRSVRAHARLNLPATSHGATWTNSFRRASKSTPSVCLSVRPSVTLVDHTKTAWDIEIWFTPHPDARGLLRYRVWRYGNPVVGRCGIN